VPANARYGPRSADEEVCEVTIDVQRGDTVLVDGRELCVVERTGMYAGSTRSSTRLEGVTVRPVEGGRARVVALRRITLPKK
jgi:hypothetical protein